MARILFGPAGWSYRDWEGVVYPPQPPRNFDRPAFLAQYFDTLELNSTFYRTPTLQTARGWARRAREANPRFQFTAKLLQNFTHQRKATAKDEGEVHGYLDALAAEQALGALLFQFPWSCRNTAENRAHIERLAKTFDAYPRALEVRHSSWDNPELRQWLRERNMALCSIDQPIIGESLEPSDEVTAPLAYVRLHGRNYERWFNRDTERDDAARQIVRAQKGSARGKTASVAEDGDFLRPDEASRRYDYLYSEAEMRQWADRVLRIARQATVTYVVANNHFEGKAVANAMQLSWMVAGTKVDVPPGLLQRYPQLERLHQAHQRALF